MSSQSYEFKMTPLALVSSGMKNEYTPMKNASAFHRAALELLIHCAGHCPIEIHGKVLLRVLSIERLFLLKKRDAFVYKIMRAL